MTCSFRDKPRNLKFGLWFMDFSIDLVWLRTTHYHSDSLIVTLIVDDDLLEHRTTPGSPSCYLPRMTWDTFWTHRVTQGGYMNHLLMYSHSDPLKVMGWGWWPIRTEPLAHSRLYLIESLWVTFTPFCDFFLLEASFLLKSCRRVVRQ